MDFIGSVIGITTTSNLPLIAKEVEVIDNRSYLIDKLDRINNLKIDKLLNFSSIVITNHGEIYFTKAISVTNGNNIYKWDLEYLETTQAFDILCVTLVDDEGYVLVHHRNHWILGIGDTFKYNHILELDPKSITDVKKGKIGAIGLQAVTNRTTTRKIRL